MITHFLFDLGNTLIRLAYERVVESICRDASLTRDELVELVEGPGGYRDMERGTISFWEFYDFLCEKGGYRGSIKDFHEIWCNFFDGPVQGIEEVLTRVRDRYRVAFLSNSNEVHESVIPQQFPMLFRDDDQFIYSHRFRAAKPDPQLYRAALEVIGAQPEAVAFVDDLPENVDAARAIGMRAYRFTDSETLMRELTRDGLL